MCDRERTGHCGKCGAALMDNDPCERCVDPPLGEPEVYCTRCGWRGLEEDLMVGDRCPGAGCRRRDGLRWWDTGRRYDCEAMWRD